MSISGINTSSPAASPHIANQPRQTPGQDVEKKSDTALKAPSIDYPGGVTLIIVFVGLFLAALCVGLVRSLNFYGLGWCFWINLPLGTVTLLTVFFLVKIPADPNRKSKGTLKGFLDRFDLIGTLILIPWIICLLLALQWGGSQYSWNSWRIILLLVLFAVLFVIWLYI